MKTITARTVDKSITDHPNFYKPQYDWGVIPASYHEAYEDCDGVWHEEGTIPEDRSGWRQDLEGKSMADLWDYEKGEFTPDARQLGGITTYLTTEITETESE